MSCQLCSLVQVSEFVAQTFTSLGYQALSETAVSCESAKHDAASSSRFSAILLSPPARTREADHESTLTPRLCRAVNAPDACEACCRSSWWRLLGSFKCNPEVINHF